MDVAGKVAIITGASRGLGKAMALTFARAGMQVVIAARTEEPHPRIGGTIFQTAEEVRAGGGSALPIRCNVFLAEDIEVMVKRTIDELGHVDVVVHNAAANIAGGVSEVGLRGWDILMGVNVRALYALAREVLPSMRAQGGGHILSVSPKAETFTGGGPYQQSKAAATRLALSMAEEFGKDGIAVNCLWPEGLRRTEGTVAMARGAIAPDALSPQLFADAALAIVSKDPRAYTGHTLLDKEVLQEAGVTDFSKYVLT